MQAEGGETGGRPSERWVAVGMVGKTVGLRGEVVVRLFAPTDDWLAPGVRVVLVKGDRRLPARVAATRQQSQRLVVRFAEFERIEGVQPWVGADLEVRAEELPELEEGAYYHFELIGMRVYAADGRLLGTVAEILETGGNDVYCVRDGQREILVPAVREAIAEIDPASGRMVLKDLEGLIEP